MEDISDVLDKNPFGAQIFIFNKNLHKYLSKGLKPYDIDIIQGLFLLRIYYHPNLSQNNLAEAFYLSKGTVAKNLRKLEDKQLVIRERLPENRRKYKLNITNTGKELIPIIKKQRELWENAMGLDKVDPEFFKIIKELTIKSIKINEND